MWTKLDTLFSTHMWYMRLGCTREVYTSLRIYDDCFFGIIKFFGYSGSGKTCMLCSCTGCKGKEWIVGIVEISWKRTCVLFAGKNAICHYRPHIRPVSQKITENFVTKPRAKIVLIKSIQNLTSGHSQTLKKCTYWRIVHTLFLSNYYHKRIYYDIVWINPILSWLFWSLMKRMHTCLLPYNKPLSCHLNRFQTPSD